jgi:hypothetical protein
MLADLREQDDAAAQVRIRQLMDLGNAETVHSWLWAVNPAHGFVLDPDDYVTALRLRLGVDVAEYDGAQKCGECERRITASELGRHAMLCAKGRRTTAHNRIRDHLAGLAKICDSATETEVQWAAAVGSGGPNIDARRPADILTSAAPLGGVGYVALDVGITTPFTVAAMSRPDYDVLGAYRAEKVRKYATAAADAKWDYRPVIISAFGRRHTDAKHVVHRLAVAAAKRFGVKSATKIEDAWWRNCGTLLMERACRMVERCHPTAVLPAAYGGVADDASGAPHAERRWRADGAPGVGADGPAVPVGD